MKHHFPIRNEDQTRMFDAVIDGEDIYIEVKNAKAREIIRLCDVLAQIEQAKRKASES